MAYNGVEADQGSYKVVINGQQQGPYFNDLGAAQQAYNSAAGLSNTVTPTVTGGGTQLGGVVTPVTPTQTNAQQMAALSAMFGSSSDLNWADLNEKKREFDASNALAQQQLGLNQNIATGYVAPDAAKLNTIYGNAPNYANAPSLGEVLASPAYQNWKAKQIQAGTFDPNDPYGGLGTPTLANTLQNATLTGQYNNAPTEAARQFNENARRANELQGATLTGKINGSPTEAARQFNANLISSAPKGSADAFSYMAKLDAMRQAGINPTADILGGAMQNATGQSMGQLQAAPLYTNTQLASDIVQAGNGGQVSPAGQNFLSRIYGTPAPAPAAQPATGAAPAAGAPRGFATPSGMQNGIQDPATGLWYDNHGNGQTIEQLIGALHQSQPANNGANDRMTAGMGMNENTGQPNAGNGGALNNWSGASWQGYNRLDPSLQAATQDLYSVNGGDPNDLLARMKKAAPSSSFAQTPYARMGV